MPLDGTEHRMRGSFNNTPARRGRNLRTLLALLVVLTTLSGALAQAGGAGATAGAGAGIPTSPIKTLKAFYPNLQEGTPLTKEMELDGMTTELVTSGGDPGAVMRQRPFIIGEKALETTYAQKSTFQMPKDLDEEDGGRAELVAFLNRRGADAATIDEAVRRFDDRATKKIIPDTVLRAAVLMLSGWDPYQASIDAILDGQNPTGEPYLGVIFDRIDEGAVGTLIEDEATGYHVLVVNSKFERTLPEVLIPTIVHETLHGGGRNSAEEEIIANILDAVCWGELLLIQPDLALAPSPVTLDNNFKLTALLNSSGRAGPEEIGIATSPYGDVIIGVGMELADAESIRALIELDWFYDALLNVGSDGQQTAAALLKRFPGGKELGQTPRFDEDTLALIDAGVREVIDQGKAVRLAEILRLEKTTKFKEGTAKGKLSDDFADDAGRRPFVATDVRVFSYSKAATTSKPLSEKGARKVLGSWLKARKADKEVTAGTLALYDADTTRAQIPDPALRAAAAMLYQWAPWDLAYAAIFEGKNPDGVPLRIEFRAMRDSAPVARQSDTQGDGTPAAILVNSLLAGESPQLLASVLVEGVLLHDATLLKEEAISAAAIGTLTWADIIAAQPEEALATTWGVLQRNLYLLAMLNTAGTRGDIGILTEPGEDADVLLGVFPDAVTFAKLIDSTPWGVHFDRSTQLVAPPVFITLVQNAGITLHTTTDGVIAYGDETLADLDLAIGYYLTPEKATTVAKALKLRTAVA